MAALTPVTLSRAGVNSASGAAATVTVGDTFVNDGATAFLVKNGSGASITFSVPFGQTVDGQTVPSKSITIPAGETGLMGPFPLGLPYTDASGNVTGICSAVTSVTIKAVKLSLT